MGLPVPFEFQSGDIGIESCVITRHLRPDKLRRRASFDCVSTGNSDGAWALCQAWEASERRAERRAV
jgi:hypothetical protein